MREAGDTAEHPCEDGPVAALGQWRGPGTSSTQPRAGCRMASAHVWADSTVQQQQRQQAQPFRLVVTPAGGEAGAEGGSL